MSSAIAATCASAEGIERQLQVVNLGIFDDGLGQSLFAVGTMRIALGVDQRPVVLDQALERFPGQVQPVEVRIAPLQPGHDAQRLGVVVEAAVRRHQAVEFALAGMAEGRVAEVMGQGQRLGQILVEPERARDGAGDLRHLDRSGSGACGSSRPRDRRRPASCA